ncbi:MAG TPA: PepSY domain-containing protein [Rubrivivax sp.]|nr:PepSY domain-containing protein [Rubrivivax sp.]
MRTLMLALCLAATGAMAQEHTEKCEPMPKEEWRPQAELEKMLVNKGWNISRVKIANGCCEVYARDAKNAKKEVFFHPKTFDLVTAPQ